MDRYSGLVMNIPPSGQTLTAAVEVERHLRLLMDADMAFNPRIMFMNVLRGKAGESIHVPASLVRALDFAECIDYQHGSVPAQVYLRHPYRVAMLATQKIDVIDYERIIIALLHNVLEVSKVSESEIFGIAGSNVLEALKALTVDRRRQEDPVYKDAYYKHIEEISPSCASVKIFDKLDNIYMVCFNPSESIRNSYLDEIDRWVVPMACRVMPDIGEYMQGVSGVMRNIGYLDKIEELDRARKTYEL